MHTYSNNIELRQRLKLRPHHTINYLDNKSIIFQYWEKYCKNSQLHGIRYLSRETSSNIERKVWFVFITFGILCTIYMYVSLSIRYKEHLLQTVVENTQLPVYKIVFPSVALCTKNRINWTKVEDAENMLIPNPEDSKLKTLFRQFIKYLQYFRFGNISEVDGIENLDLKALDFLNITSLAEFLSYRCEDILINCIWRKQQYSCCDLFVLRRTEVGYCLVFNSLVSGKDRSKKVSR